jgi:predicted nuclease of predicted toxin-antitoxin system
MTLRFLIDAQLPPTLASHLSTHGFKAEHVNRIGLGASDDARIWAYAGEHRAVLITKDGDFAALARRSRTGPQVVWIRLGNVTNRALCAAFQHVLTEIVDGLNSGDRVIELE